MDSNEVSVVIPVYNCRKRIKHCIDSICKQTYPNYSILIVDDGSTDGTAEICDKFAENNKRINVIHSENKGVSTARNTGLQNIKGTYVMFVDADDWIPSTAIETLVSGMHDDETDLVVGSKEWVDGFKNVVTRYKDQTVVKGQPEWSEALTKMYCAVWAKLYKRSIIEEHQLTFPADLKYSEDVIFLCNYLAKCRKATFSSQVVYYENRLYGNTAVMKYYPDFLKWQGMVLERFQTIVDERHLTLIAQRRLMEACKHYVINGAHETREHVLEKMRESYQQLGQCVGDLTLVPSDGREHQLYVCLKEDRVEDAYQLVNVKQQRSFKAKMKYRLGRYGKRLLYYKSIK